jgi:EmrB/QacA subfamily drug resistance transporter
LFRFQEWNVFGVVATGVFLSTMDSSMVNIALPFIMESFDSQLNRVEWVVMAYLLTITTTLLLWGYLADRIGRRRVYGSGLLVFSAGAFACYWAPSLSFLIAFRFLQAIGASCMMATGPAIIRHTFPAEKLGRALGTVGVAVSLGLMSGPLVGGVLIDLFSWRALFLCTAPIALGGGVLAFYIIPATERQRTPYRFDWPGGFCWTLTVVFLSLAITHTSSTDWSSVKTGTAALCGVLFLVAFFVFEKKTYSPLLPLLLVRQQYYWKAVVCAALSFFVLFSIIMIMPFYLDRVRLLSASIIGITMLAVPLAALLVAPIAGAASDRIGFKSLTSFGLLLSSSGVLGLSFLGPSSSLPIVGLLLAMVGGGQAMFLSPNSSSLLGHVPGHYAAISAALLATARNLGMLLGIAVTGLIFSSSFNRLTGGLDLRDYTAGYQNAFLLAMQHAFWAAAFCGFLAAAIAWSRGDRKLEGHLLISKEF